MVAAWSRCWPAFFGALGWALGGPQTASVFVFCTLLAALAVYAYADRALLGMLGAREYALAEDPLLRSTVDALAAKLGVVPPKLYLIPDGYPRALAAGRGPAGSSIAVSTGLLGALTPAELEAVIAHELAHVRRRDVLDADLRRHARGRPRRPLPDRRLVRAGAAGHPRPDRSRVRPPPALAAARARGRPDGVVELLGSGDGLADALLKLDRASDLVSFQASPATEPLYTVNPFAEEGLAALFVTHPPLQERLLRLTG